MDTLDCIATKVEVRKFARKPVYAEAKLKILEVARLTGSSMNSQHWRFIVIQDPNNLKRLAEDSTTGRWAASCDFAVIILTNPKVPGYTIDGGRVLQDMQLAAWNLGIGSGIFTGVNEEKMRKDFQIPNDLKITATVCFGYPPGNITGKKKNRKSLAEIAFGEK
ncbi:MAG: nitroreductase family protein, partial [Nitrososphaerota archaeon]|nr:nitroreductase family protein [Nitrososphaerota archaeon]